MCGCLSNDYVPPITPTDPPMSDDEVNNDTTSDMNGKKETFFEFLIKFIVNFLKKLFNIN